MRGFVNFILRGRLQALLVTAVASALTLMLPLFSHVAGGTLALVTLRNGFTEGLLIALGATVVLGGLGYVSNIAPGVVGTIVVAMLALMWAPVLVTAHVLRITRSIDLALLGAGAMAAAAMLALYAYVGDPVSWWREMLNASLTPLLEQLNIPLAGVDRDETIEALARMMTGALAATVLFTAMINLFIGRWAQALLFNPGGFGAEFRSLRLGRQMGIAAVLVLAVASFLGGGIGGLALNLTFLIGAMYTLHGLALVHGVVAIKGAHSGWLIGLYVAMLFALPQVALVLSAAGFADSWLDVRSRLRGGTST